MSFWLLFLHILGACIWIGGHLYLVLTVLPKAIAQQDTQLLLNFEASFEKLGMTALITQVITGIIMANKLLPDWSQLFDHSQDMPLLITLKLTWLVLTIITAISAQLIVIPKIKKDLQNPKLRKVFAGHIGFITLLSLAFLVTGVLFRTGFHAF